MAVRVVEELRQLRPASPGNLRVALRPPLSPASYAQTASVDVPVDMGVLYETIMRVGHRYILTDPQIKHMQAGDEAVPHVIACRSILEHLYGEVKQDLRQIIMDVAQSPDYEMRENVLPALTRLLQDLEL